MAPILSRRTLLKHTRNSLYAIPFGPTLLSSAVYHITNSGTDKSQSYFWRNVVTGGGGGFVVDVIFNHKQKDLIYARTDIGGAYRWNPKTGTWIQLLAWVGPNDWNLTGVESLATDPVEPNRLYIAAGTYTNSWASTNGAILRSEDYGKTFRQTSMPFKMGGNMPGRGMSERLAIDPNDNSILYFGARSGNGLWKSTNHGVTWSKITNFPDTGPFSENPADSSGYSSDPIGVVWVTFDPATGKRGKPTGTIYVGVADNSSGASNIYRSTDAGTTWAPIPGQPISTVNGATVTVTGGATWDLSKNASTGFLPHQGKLDSEGTLYITYSDWEGPYNGSHGDVWKFVPGTSTWTKISPVPGSNTSNNYFGYGGLGVDMQHPGTLVVAPVNLWWPDAELYRTTDGGATWKTIWEWGSYPNRIFHHTIDSSNAPWLDFGNPNPAPPALPVGIGWMIEGLNIDPFNSDRMMYGTGATLFATNNLTAWDSGGLVAIKSTALGIEEMAVTELVSPPSGAHLLSGVLDVEGFRHDDLTKSPVTMYTNPRWGQATTIDYAELQPSFVVRVGRDTGVIGSSFSSDGGTTWTPASANPSGYTGNNTSMIAVAADGSRVVWSVPGGSVSYSTDNGTSWGSSTGIPQGALVLSDRVNPQKFYGFLNSIFYRSTDGGVTFTATAATGLPSAGSTSTRLVKAMPGHEGDIWLASGSSATTLPAGLWHSTNNGTSFTQLANVTRAYTIGFGKAAPERPYMALYITGIIGGIIGVFRSDDAGEHWVRVNDDRHQYGSINSAITGDPRVYGRVYVGTNGMGIVYGDITDNNE